MTAPLPLPGERPDVLIPLALHRDRCQVQAALCVVALDVVMLRSHQEAYLSPSESQMLDGMAAKKRADDFLIGRYACKRTIAHLFPEEDMRALCVVAGVFSQPVLQSLRNLGLEVSISHNLGIGAAIAAPETHPMAVDIEHYDKSNLEAITSQMTKGELALVELVGLSHLQGMTMLWAMKEALSKVLRCGLMVPFILLEVTHLERTGHHVCGLFRHFSQYRAVAIDLGQFTCAVALPRETHGLKLDALIAKFASTDTYSKP